MTAVLQHMGTHGDPAIHTFESTVLLKNKWENYTWLNKSLNWRGCTYLWDGLAFLTFKPALQMEALMTSS